MRVLYILFLLLFLSSVKVHAIKPEFRYLTTEHGLGSNIVRWTYQDSDGYIWISTKAGLSRYDGYEVKNYFVGEYKAHSLKGMVIGSPHEINDDCLLFSSSRGIVRYNKCLDQFTYFPGKQNEFTHTQFLTADGNGNLWVFKKEVGFLKLRYDGNSFRVVQCIDGGEKGYELRKAQMIYPDSNGDVWLFSLDFIAVVRSDNTIEYTKNWSISYKALHEYSSQNYILSDGAGFFYQLNPKTLEVSPYKQNFTKQRDIRHNFNSLFVDSEHVIGTSRKEGLFFLNQNTQKQEISLISHFQKQPNVAHSLSSNNIRHIMVDRAGMVWLSTDGGGVCYFSLSPDKFKHISYNETKGGLSDSYISALYEDRNENLWVSVWQSEVNVLPAHREYSSFVYLKNEDIVEDISKGYGSVFSFGEIKFGDNYVMLLGTAGFRCLQEYANLNFTQPTVRNFSANSIARKSRIDDFLVEENKLWICRPEEGLEYHTFDEQGKNISSFFFDKQLQYKKVFEQAGQCHDLHKDGNGTIWALCEATLFQVIDSSGTPTLRAHNISYRMKMMLEDRHGNLWIVTKGKGLIKLRFDQQGKLLERTDFTLENGFADNFLYSLSEDNNGYLWIAANVGIIRFDPRTEELQVYGEREGINGKNFTEKCCLYRKNGEMLFGTTNGLFVFRPEELTNDSIVQETTITGFSIFDRRMQIGDKLYGKTILAQEISRTKLIEIPYEANVISFEFSSLLYGQSGVDGYAFMLEGFDQKWRHINASDRKATYTNLQDGAYVFKVKSTSRGGVEDDTPATVRVVITPPLWRTIPAYLFYLALCLGLLFLVRRYYLNRLEMRQALEMERFERQKIEELSQMKIRFFTNISHEFRTPLSLIKASFDSLSPELFRIENKQDNEYLDIAKRNIGMLVRLVNQLIDVRRFETGKMNIEPTNTEMVSFVNASASSFVVMANGRGIQFQYTSTVAEVYAFIDRDQIEKVIYNLLSNAFKHTPKGGRISLHLTLKTKFLEICVQDNGNGISQKHQTALFQRFYQGEKEQVESMGSSGIGLSLTKEFVEMHGGKISFVSNEGEGTTFVVCLPRVQKSCTEEKNVNIYTLQNEPCTSESEQKNAIQMHFDPKKKTVLVVEDNIDLRTFLVKTLNTIYNVLEAENGALGLSVCLSAKSTEIDLVISDVMMPKKNGYQLCDEIKNNLETSHIPVLLLTAKTADEHKLEGYSKGADAYIEKPFNVDVLKAQIGSILISKQKIQEFYMQSDSLRLQPFKSRKIKNKQRKEGAKEDKKNVSNPTIKVSDYDSLLMEKVVTTIQSKMHETEFSVEELASACAVSESTLRRKVKALTGESPSALIRHRKIVYAASLLKNKDCTVYDAMHQTGFSNYSNFSKLFLRIYQCTPGDFRKQENDSDFCSSLSN